MNVVTMLVRASKAVGLLGMMVLHEDLDAYPVPYNVTYYDNGDVEVEWRDVKNFNDTVAYEMLCYVMNALDTDDYCMTETYGTVFKSTIITGNYIHEEVEE